jgi:HTH-type transcriptional regulator/antitoxin HigA
MANMARRIVAESFPIGEFIEEELQERSWTEQDLADKLMANVATIRVLLKGKKPINPATVQNLADVFGTSVEFWMNLERLYRSRNGRNKK